jgi:hypothetical protein
VIAQMFSLSLQAVFQRLAVRRLRSAGQSDGRIVFLIAGRRGRRGWSGLGAGQGAAPQAAASPRQLERKDDDDDRTSCAHIEYGAE